jgi:UDP-N-acetylglucosamine--N-acetylmuramyl-(pentapeptide) pyrophosphoryl-undecaprenol N-acetylglucosamine transferase
MERSLVPPTGVRCFLVPMAPPTSLHGVFLLATATIRSLVVMSRVRPRVTVATGGYASTPAALASWLMRIPVVLFLPDVFPGKAVTWLAPLSRKIAVTSEVTARHFPPNKTSVTGYPLRDAFVSPSRARGRQRFALPLDADVVCVFGGSQGARHINQALGRQLPEVLLRCFVLHICGEQRWDEAESAAADLSEEARARYRLFAYLHDEDMADALAAADLAVCRAGASVLGELPATGTPAILVPLPQTAVHQRENAEYLADRGAAVILDDRSVDSELGMLIYDLLTDRPRLAAMTHEARRLARPNATEAIIDLLDEVSG